MTPLRQHLERWKDGCGSEECSNHGTRVVLARGQFPCDVLFVGEAPGESENVVGSCFVGPAGKLLDRIIADSVGAQDVCPVCRMCSTLDESTGERICKNHPSDDIGPYLRVGLTNLVGCIPRDGTKKATEPDDSQIKACAPRLKDLVAIALPKLIVTVGKLPEAWLQTGFKDSIEFKHKPKRIAIIHPAFILRANVAQQGLLIQKATVTIACAIRDTF